ncbi:RNA-binding protein [Brachybacterium avium]|uniref:RNA-binding protein n=1 Tax=Brachybacterium avium TaxID=2017485 RepID=A0A220UC69_9MICO|nr:R3H domain-containing nucleic acid-binding protein [Brachybacterium avium]ASK65818.1 RNA-binding protein [Brachybacterium avium]
MNVNDGTPAPTAAEDSSSQQHFETETAQTPEPAETAQTAASASAESEAAVAAEPADEAAAEAAPEDAVAAEDTTSSAASASDAPSEGDDEPVSEESAEERVRRLEEEGDIAADYLEELLDITDLDGDMDIDVDGDRASVEIRGADKLARLNRPKGELLDALQELARLAVQTRTGQRSRLMLDIGGFRAEHKSNLEELAETAIAEAKEAGAPVPMRAMNPFERKVVHDVAKREGLRSESDGDGKNRHVVIYPAS